MALGPHQKKIILELGDAEDWVPTSAAYTQQYHSLHAKGLIAVTGSNKHARLTAEGITVYTALKYPGGIAPRPKDQSTAVPAHPNTVGNDGKESEMRELTRHIRLDEKEGELLTKVVAGYLPQGLPFYIASRNSCTKYLVSQGLISEKQTEAGVYLYPTLKGAMWAVCNDYELYTPFVQNSHRFQLSVNADRKLPKPKKAKPSELDTLKEITKKDPEGKGYLIQSFGLTPDDLDTLRRFHSSDRQDTEVKAWVELPTLDEESDYKPTRRVQRLVRDEMIKALLAPYMRLVVIGLAYCPLKEATEDGVEFGLNFDGKEVWGAFK